MSSMTEKRTEPFALAHSLQRRHITMISIGGVIGAGFFIGSSSAIATAGPGILITYILAGLTILLVNVMLRDIALQVPGLGSFIMQIRVALGARTGFVAGWTYWLIWVTTLAIEIIGASTILERYVPLPYAVLECSVLAVMTAVNVGSVRGYGEFEYWFALVKVLAISAFIVIGAYALAGNPRLTWSSDWADSLFPNGITAALSMLPTVVFSMSGSEVATVAALESQTPDRNIARVTRSVALRIVGFYLTSLTLLLCLVPWRNVIPGESPFILALYRLHIPFAGLAMTLVILTAMLSTLNSGLYVASRILFEMTENGDAPGFLSRLGPRSRTPRRAVLACAAATLLIAGTAVVSPTIVFGMLISVTGAFIVSNYILIVLARLRLCPTRRWTAWLALLLLAGVLASMLARSETRHELALGLIALIAIISAARLSGGRNDLATETMQ